MYDIIIAGSRYVLMIVFALYVYQSFKMDVVTGADKKKKMHASQNAMMLIILCVAFLVIGMSVYTNGEEEGVGGVLIFFACVFAYLLIFNVIAPIIYENINRGLVSMISMFLCIGFIELTRLSFDRATKQFTILLISTVVFFLIPVVLRMLGDLSRFKWIYCGVGLALLLIMLLFSRFSNGAKISIDIGSFSFQPLEFIKILFVFFIAALFHEGVNRRSVLIGTILTFTFIMILVLSKDLGTALILFLAYLFMLYAATKKIAFLGAGVILLSGAALIAYKLFNHVRVRVMAWLDPWTDIDSGGYQITQSLFAIGTGGWIGMGIYQGMPGKVPEVAKDFIFSAIAEELGGFFAICLILLCACCFISIMRIAMMQENMFCKLSVLGLGCVYGVQLFLTVGGALKMIPSTGVPFPFVSYGGSSMLSSMITFGIIEAFHMKALRDAKRRKIEELNRKLDEAELDYALEKELDEEDKRRR